MMLTLYLILFWSVSIIAALLMYHLWWFQPKVSRGRWEAIDAYLIKKLEAAIGKKLASVALILIQDGEIVASHCLGIANTKTQAPVKLDQTLYQLASVSKLVTAWGVMRLAQDGRLALDKPVYRYLTRWQFPPSAHRDQVTVRHLLSHTAGLNDMLGYNGFLPGEPIQSLEDSLTLANDPASGKPRGVAVVREPGKNWLYSGGGYGVLQLLIEEVTHMSFAQYMDKAVLQPLGMTDASFDWETIMAEGRAMDLATSFDEKLHPTPHRRYTVTAAASLYATPLDMVELVRAYLWPNDVLRSEMLEQMISPQPGTQQEWGLGHILYMDNGYRNNGIQNYVVGHDGNNLPATAHTVRINPVTGHGLILMSSGNLKLANRLGDDWVFWETGKLSTNARINRLIDQLMPTLVFIGLGAIAIVIGVHIWG
jgi:CubicO group peptidase (beta-lactamase class C family)